jgi:hypothetical protein
MIDSAEQELGEIGKEEIDGDYSDAMLSMERTEAYGRARALCEAYFVFFGEEYLSPEAVDLSAYEDEKDAE